LFTGDHIMGWSTTVVTPPDGDMADYIASVEKLERRGDRTLYPTHGAPVTDPGPFLAAYREHRLDRERQVLASIAAGRDTIPAMVAHMYADVDKRLHPAASRSVLAHLIKLERGRGPARRTVGPHQGQPHRPGRAEARTWRGGRGDRAAPLHAAARPDGPARAPFPASLQRDAVGRSGAEAERGLSHRARRQPCARHARRRLHRAARSGHRGRGLCRRGAEARHRGGPDARPAPLRRRSGHRGDGLLWPGAQGLPPGLLLSAGRGGGE